ncbi:phage baseplate assembly protein V [Marinomonas sp. TW1]|uniref:phage baseplate assembly protein V n=1 Tax=Marinomonas sp. TW1 TaxID=1561203 RepID=UPI000A5707BB|nr:phage baseplate assembly protein V [Marinomonas sp. TW1]
MRQLIEAMVRDMLTPYLDRIEELSEETEDLRRRLQSMVRLGFVCEIHESNTLIRVQHGALTSPFIRWFSTAAGATTDYRCPSLGEQAVLLNYGAGHNGTQTVALIGLFSDKFPAPSQDANEIVRCYPDGSLVSYHTQKHQMTIKSVGDLSINVGGSAVVAVEQNATVDVKGKTALTSSGDTTVDASNIKLNGGTGVVTGAHKCMITGLPHADCSSTVTAAK